MSLYVGDRQVYTCTLDYFHEQGKKSFRFHMPIYRRQ